jgi:hypothetical protein
MCTEEWGPYQVLPLQILAPISAPLTDTLCYIPQVVQAHVVIELQVCYGRFFIVIYKSLFAFILPFDNVKTEH